MFSLTFIQYELWNQMRRPLLATGKKGNLRHFCIGFTFQTWMSIVKSQGNGGVVSVPVRDQLIELTDSILRFAGLVWPIPKISSV